MKRIHYCINTAQPDPGEEPRLCAVTISWSEENEAIAKAEAYLGEYTVEDDGTEELPQPTQAERIAQLEEALELLLSGVTE